MDKNLKEIYEEIAFEFDSTRQFVWPCVKLFLDNIKENSMGLEIGCGNGKNMRYRNDLKMKGIDFCENFIKICHKNNLDCKIGDMRNIEYNDNLFDFTLSVAVLHHLYKPEDRLKALKEHIRVTKVGGKLFILVWAHQQKEERRQLNKKDEMVSWQRKTGEIVYRYYHMYDKDELINELKNFKNINIDKIFYERGNWGVIFTKTN